MVNITKVVIVILLFLSCNKGVAATASWTGITFYNGGNPFGISNSQEYCFLGSIHGEDGKNAGILSFIHGHMEDSKFYLKHEDFSLESMDPTFNWWALATYGETVAEETFDAASPNRIVDSWNDFYNGGTVVENPSDFYMAFKASEVIFVSGVGYEEGETWYGWVHVSVDDDLNMTLLDEGINLYGGPVIVGAIPEPSAAVLVLVGLAALALRRRRRWAR